MNFLRNFRSKEKAKQESLKDALKDANYRTLEEKKLVFSYDQLHDKNELIEIIPYIANEASQLPNNASLKAESVFFIFDFRDRTYLFKFKKDFETATCVISFPGKGGGLDEAVKNYEHDIQFIFTPSGLYQKKDYINRIIKNDKGEDENPVKRYNCFGYAKRYGF